MQDEERHGYYYMKITFLIDNISNRDDLLPEWGLAIHIEYQGTNILLDTGSSCKFSKNARVLGIDLAKVDYGVLSHAHYDHANGLDTFFDINKTAKFYLQEGSKENCYSKHGFFKKYIGIKKGWLQKYADRFAYASGDYQLIDGVYIIPHKTPGLEAIAKKAKLYIKEGRKIISDNFSHEQSLVFDTDKGMVIFNSCSHGGADNIIREIQSTFPDKKIYALIGGFHLFTTPASDVKALASRIKETNIEKIITGHCTGNRAYNILKEELDSQCEMIYSGLEIEI